MLRAVSLDLYLLRRYMQFVEAFKKKEHFKVSMSKDQVELAATEIEETVGRYPELQTYGAYSVYFWMIEKYPGKDGNGQGKKTKANGEVTHDGQWKDGKL